ncbi:polysaccharide biosynthesis tyrosine autokinase [Staphylococcus massiliensis]|uniref:non-specific protein-tyrosine kinase n=1 Tax=Staphylococcus massiliensis S46 TaxID=1229783 RepID=K9AV73_9STAP|nr:polysaccharide biosynthesis tyrosine autokinase [Staphylococcus massiliensis]EKU49996.1 capsular polysaccharide synthesis protein [Staphylococcus massiliensis S46]MCG3411736.1 polysaccharide biosynthesis tyrosine autokinase [Staphylococcus massiliensis]POA00556.1 capsular biosynthesis protein [Staphylococcus massiliensis CCUG 55927]HAC5789069.1 polysaccharide biosynthesis tyrosine autokinase [Listeria monocytogenes]
MRKSPTRGGMKTLIAHTNRKSVMSERFRGIRTNIMFSASDKAISTLVITSERPSSGKSTMSSNIAVTYAQAGFKTLVLDGDMRKPTQHYIFGVQNQKGLSNVLINQHEPEEVIESTMVENLFILPSGPIPPNPSELIGSVKLETLINLLNETFDMIIIDTPPVLSVTDAQLFTEVARNVLFVIDAEMNNRDHVRKAMNLVKKANGKVIGAVLNNAKVSKAQNAGYSYYGED